MVSTKEQIHNQDINKSQYGLVVKSNELVRNTRYELSTVEQKLLIFIISKVGKEKDLKEVTLSVSEYCNIAGIDIKSGNTYTFIKNQIKQLSDKSWWLPSKDGSKVVLFRWFESASFGNSGVISIKLSEMLKPYLLDLKENFTQYELINVLALRSKYSIRLYEIFKSYLWQNEWVVTLEELRNILDVKNKYLEFKDFNKAVIKTAIDEINDYTDIIVECEPIRSGKFISKLHFKIKADAVTDGNYMSILEKMNRVSKRVDKKNNQ